MRRDSFSDDDYCAARRRHLATYAEYATNQHLYALHAPCRQAGHVRAGDRRERAQHLLR